MIQPRAPPAEADTRLLGGPQLPPRPTQCLLPSQTTVIPRPRVYGSIQTPPPRLPPPPPPAYAHRNYTWFEDFQRNKPQIRSVAPALLIFVSAGMSLSVSVGFGPTDTLTNHAQYCWFIAVIVGASISAVLAKNIKKIVFNLLTSILIIVSGIIYIASEACTTRIILARYCNGIAFGLTIIPFIIVGSEQCTQRFRSLVMSFEHIGLISGVLFVTVYSATTNPTKDKEIIQTQGICDLVYGVTAFVFSFFMTIESPIFHLRKNNEAEAINVLRQLQKPQTVSDETIAILNENKALLNEDLIRGRAENISSSWIPFFKICMLRAVVSLSFALPLTWALTLVSSKMSSGDSEANPIIYVSMRLTGILFSIWIPDRFDLGRRTLCALSLLIGSLLLLILGSVFSIFSELSDEDLNPAITLLVIYQLLSGFVASTSTCYLSEAFSISVKPYFILLAIIIENIIQIIVCSLSTEDLISNYAYTLAAIQLSFALVFYLTFPEIKQATLREALDMFKMGYQSV